MTGQAPTPTHNGETLGPSPHPVPMPMNLSKHLLTDWLGVSTVELCGWKKRDLGGILRYVRAQKVGGAETSFRSPSLESGGGELPPSPPPFLRLCHNQNVAPYGYSSASERPSLRVLSWLHGYCSKLGSCSEISWEPLVHEREEGSRLASTGAHDSRSRAVLSPESIWCYSRNYAYTQVHAIILKGAKGNPVKETNPVPILVSNASNSDERLRHPHCPCYLYGGDWSRVGVSKWCADTVPRPWKPGRRIFLPV